MGELLDVGLLLDDARLLFELLSLLIDDATLVSLVRRHEHRQVRHDDGDDEHDRHHDQSLKLPRPLERDGFFGSDVSRVHRGVALLKLDEKRWDRVALVAEGAKLECRGEPLLKPKPGLGDTRGGHDADRTHGGDDRSDADADEDAERDEDLQHQPVRQEVEVAQNDRDQPDSLTDQRAESGAAHPPDPLHTTDDLMEGVVERRRSGLPAGPGRWIVRLLLDGHFTYANFATRWI